MLKKKTAFYFFRLILLFFMIDYEKTSFSIGLPPLAKGGRRLRYGRTRKFLFAVAFILDQTFC